jgi:hypothetical protein
MRLGIKRRRERPKQLLVIAQIWCMRCDRSMILMIALFGSGDASFVSWKRCSRTYCGLMLIWP